MSEEQIQTAKRGGVLEITLDRPQRLNAFTEQMQGELIDAFTAADADDEVRAIIVTGAGRAFCAGADLSAGEGTFAGDDEAKPIEPTHFRDGGGLLSLTVYESRKPVIAAINGPAVGVGITMTLPMDVRIASTEARIGFVFSRRGIVPEACSTWFLPRLVGPAQAAEWFYTGRVFDAAEALAGGLVSRVCAPDELLPTARALATEIVDNTAPVSVALCRQMLYYGLEARHPMDSHRVESLGIYWRGRSPDVAEGVRSFLDKRAPHFPMRPSHDMPPYYPWRHAPAFTDGIEEED